MRIGSLLAAGAMAWAVFVGPASTNGVPDWVSRTGELVACLIPMEPTVFPLQCSDRAPSGSGSEEVSSGE